MPPEMAREELLKEVVRIGKEKENQEQTI